MYRVKKGEKVLTKINACIKTLKENLYKYDAGYWSRYDLLKKELVRFYYQKNVHVPQLNVLYQLTNEPVFEQYMKKWERNISTFNYLLVQIMYRVEPRVRKLINTFK